MQDIQYILQGKCGAGSFIHVGGDAVAALHEQHV